jgi:hypothetical protein
VLAMDELYSALYAMDQSDRKNAMLDERMELIRAMRTIKRMFEISDDDLITARVEQARAAYLNLINSKGN